MEGTRLTTKMEVIYDGSPESMQLYFDRTVAYLRSQKEQAVRKTTGACAYRLPNGNKCAVGFHIPDDYPKWNTVNYGVKTVNELPKDLDGIAWPVGEEGVELAQNLQICHDLCWDNKEEKLKSIAGMYNLAYKEA